MVPQFNSALDGFGEIRADDLNQKAVTATNVVTAFANVPKKGMVKMLEDAKVKFNKSASKDDLLTIIQRNWQKILDNMVGVMGAGGFHVENNVNERATGCGAIFVKKGDVIYPTFHTSLKGFAIIEWKALESIITKPMLDVALPQVTKKCMEELMAHCGTRLRTSGAETWNTTSRVEKCLKENWDRIMERGGYRHPTFNPPPRPQEEESEKEEDKDVEKVTVFGAEEVIGDLLVVVDAKIEKLEAIREAMLYIKSPDDENRKALEALETVRKVKQAIQKIADEIADESDEDDGSDSEKSYTEDEIVALFESVGAFEPDADEPHQELPAEKWGASGVPFIIKTITGSHCAKLCFDYSNTTVYEVKLALTDLTELKMEQFSLYGTKGRRTMPDDFTLEETGETSAYINIRMLGGGVRDVKKVTLKAKALKEKIAVARVSTANASSNVPAVVELEQAYKTFYEMADVNSVKAFGEIAKMITEGELKEIISIIEAKISPESKMKEIGNKMFFEKLTSVKSIADGLSSAVENATTLTQWAFNRAIEQNDGKFDFGRLKEIFNTEHTKKVVLREARSSGDIQMG